MIAVPQRRERAPGERETLITITVPLETVTPILGGAAAPRTLDDHDPIRVPGIRGQLRLWWRALYGHGKSAGALAQEETALWGGVHGDEPVRSRVTVWISKLERDTLWENKNKPSLKELYALWPAAENKEKRLPVAPRWEPGIRFELKLRFPKAVCEPVERTLRAWILFGGVGSRTRRGCGSVTVQATVQATAEETVQKNARERWLPKTLDELLEQFDIRGAHGVSDTPSLHGTLLVHGGLYSSSVEAWAEALGWLRDFRQGPGRDDDPRQFARGPVRIVRRGKKTIHRPGRSRWPEPDKVRQVLGRGPWAHTPQHNDKPVWPRASFGLPIIGRFQNKDIEDNEYNPRDPKNFELCWQDVSGKIHDRLASPLILKALPLANGTYAAVALWLGRGYPRGGKVGLRRKDRTGNSVLARDSAAQFDDLRAEGDPVLYKPLARGDRMRDVFVRWLVSEKKLTVLGEKAP